MNKRWPILQQRASRWLALVAIFAIGCDNVQWGGIEVEVREPTADVNTDTLALDTVAAVPPLTLPSGPVLFHVRRLDDAGRATIEPIAELAAGELKALGPLRPDRAAEYAAEFVSLYYQAGHAYSLFRGRTRVGSFFVRSPIASASDVCPELWAEGQIELRPRVDTLSEFLAWPRGSRSGADSLEVPTRRPDMSSLAQVLAQRAVREGSIGGSWRIRAPTDLRALQVGEGSLGFAATFTVADSLGQGPPSDSAGMAFLVADYIPARGYFLLYFDAVWYGPGQKRALRWVDAVDLLGDGEPEWLLRAYGDAASWYEVVGKQDTTLAVVWSSRRPVCEASQPNG